MRAAIILAVLAGSSTANADWSYRPGPDTCRNVIVGGCSRFASGWHPPMLRLEVGPVVQRTVIGPMVGTEEDGTPSGRLLTGGDLIGRGVGARMIAGYKGFYLPMDIAVTHIESGPAVHPVDVAALAVAPGETSSGWNVSMRMAFGKELRIGRLMIGGELGIGLGVVSLGDYAREHIHDPRFLLDLRAHAGVWLSPHVSLSAYTGASLVREEERMLGLALGFSLFPWDGVKN